MRYSIALSQADLTRVYASDSSHPLLLVVFDFVVCMLTGDSEQVVDLFQRM
jgi:hypothetical protein